MENIDNEKNKRADRTLLLNILSILKRYSDEEHRLSASEISKRLIKDYAMKADRKAIKRNLLTLVESGLEINYTEKKRRNKDGTEEEVWTDWYIESDFEDSELRWLIDGILFSRYIPCTQLKGLIKKLEGLSNVYFSARVKHIYALLNKNIVNKQMFYIIGILDEAISAKKRVTFLYNDYGTDKKRHPRIKDGKQRRYDVSPYHMVAVNGRYYLICNKHKYDNISNYRVDRISEIIMTDEPVKPVKQVKGMENGLNLPKFLDENIYMFSGDSAVIKFRTVKSAVNDVIDWFGEAVAFTDETEDEVTAVVTGNKEAMTYWALQYGRKVEILEPADLREQVGEAAREIAAKYGK